MFISFEGIDGCGKSTQLELLAARLKAAEYSLCVTREPGGTALAEGIREILLHSAQGVQARTELLLFGAARAAHVAQIIRPALSRGEVVLSDRFADSSIAYQAGGLGLDRDFIFKMNAFATENLTPDVTLLFDLEPSVARMRRAHETEDTIEKRGLGFQSRVRDEYLRLAADEPSRVLVLNAEISRETLHEQIVISLRERGLEI